MGDQTQDFDVCCLSTATCGSPVMVRRQKISEGRDDFLKKKNSVCTSENDDVAVALP